jgi:hypothetical protein
MLKLQSVLLPVTAYKFRLGNDGYFNRFVDAETQGQNGTSIAANKAIATKLAPAL